MASKRDSPEVLPEVIIENDKKKERAAILREKVQRAREESELLALYREEIAILKEEIGDLSEINKELDLLRRSTAVDARRKDIRYIRQLDEIMDTMLTGIIENKDDLRQAIKSIIQKGNLKLLKDLMIAFGVAIEKRESLLGFDETRQMKKRKMNLKVVFRGADGTQAGVSIEQDKS